MSTDLPSEIRSADVFAAKPTQPIAGQVTLTVTINEKGQVWDVQVSSGHPVLGEAAVSAVKQWQYSPTLFNGEPVPVIATVTVGGD